MKPWLRHYGFAAVLLACLLGLGSFLTQRRHLSGGDNRAVLALEALKDKLQATLNDPEAIALTVRLNSNRFQCLAEGGEACHDKSGMFIFYGLDGKHPLPLSQIAEEMGVSVDGIGCGKFPSVDCPIHVEASWKPVNADNGCLAKQALLFQVRIVLNSGSIFLDWKTDKVVSADVPLNAKALCRCEGKALIAGECRMETARDLAAAEGRSVDFADERREEREIAEREAAAEASGPECAPIIHFRNEEFAVMDVNSSGETAIQLEGEDNRCQTVDIFRFQCAMKQVKGKTTGEWIYAGVEKGKCPEPEAMTTNTNAGMAPASEPAEIVPGESAPMSEADVAAAKAAEERSRAPASEEPPVEENQVLEIKQGFVSEEIQQ